jgi:LDH2 family malate/lactate/ureidoglycolate dehydrogenase
MTERFGLDDLRWFAADLAAGVGLPPERAASLAGLLIWHDTAGLTAEGLASLPSWLEKLENQQVDPKTQGRIVSEHPATALVEASGGVAPLVLARAAEIASQKAREIGVGLVRVRELGAQPFALHVAAELAIGPQMGLVMGPGGTWAVGIPSSGGLPLVLGSGLGSGSRSVAPLPGELAGLVVPRDEWAVQAVSVTAFEGVGLLHERVGGWIAGADSVPRLDPARWEALRASAREQGLAVERAAWKALTQRAKSAGVAVPSPLSPRRSSDRG